MNIMKFLYILNVCIIFSMIAITLVTTSNITFSQSNNSLTFDDPLLGVKFQYTDDWIVEGSSLYKARIGMCLVTLYEISCNIN